MGAASERLFPRLARPSQLLRAGETFPGLITVATPAAVGQVSAGRRPIPGTVGTRQLVRSHLGEHCLPGGGSREPGTCGKGALAEFRPMLHAVKAPVF